MKTQTGRQKQVELDRMKDAGEKGGELAQNTAVLDVSTEEVRRREAIVAKVIGHRPVEKSIRASILMRRLEEARESIMFVWKAMEFLRALVVLEGRVDPKKVKFFSWMVDDEDGIKGVTQRFIVVFEEGFTRQPQRGIRGARRFKVAFETKHPKEARKLKKFLQENPDFRPLPEIGSVLKWTDGLIESRPVCSVGF